MSKYSSVSTVASSKPFRMPSNSRLSGASSTSPPMKFFQPVAGVMRETHPIADQYGMTPYFEAMTQANQLAIEFTQKMNLALTTIHPAAVSGGLNTGDGFTNYIKSLLNWRLRRIPVIIDGHFRIVHADSLATAILRSLGKPRAYIVSDQMTSLQKMALTLREHAKSYIPLRVPLWMAHSSTSMLEVFSRLFRIRPIMAEVQIEYITKGWEPRCDRAHEELGWQPLSLSRGIQKYLQDRTSLLGQGAAEQVRAADRWDRGDFGF